MTAPTARELVEAVSGACEAGRIPSDEMQALQARATRALLPLVEACERVLNECEAWDQDMIGDVRAALRVANGEDGE